MKKIILITLTLFVVQISIAQKINITEPEFSGIMLYANDSVGTGIRLEQQAASVSTKANAAAYVPVVGLAAGKAKSKNVVKGSSSPVVIKEKENLKFIISVKDNSVDPATIINIFPLTPEKETRTIELASASTFGGSKAGEIQFISFTAKKYGNNSYLIEIPKISVGEYAITLADRRDLFNMFSIK